MKLVGLVGVAGKSHADHSVPYLLVVSSLYSGSPWMGLSLCMFIGLLELH